MFRNMFWFDRALRTALGIIMLTMGFIGSQVILYVVGGILLVTGASGFCPLHALSGHNEADAAPATPRPTVPRVAHKAS
jgi:hypothetical protein